MTEEEAMPAMPAMPTIDDYDDDNKSEGGDDIERYIQFVHGLITGEGGPLRSHDYGDGRRMFSVYDVMRRTKSWSENALSVIYARATTGGTKAEFTPHLENIRPDGAKRVTPCMDLRGLSMLMKVIRSDCVKGDTAPRPRKRARQADGQADVRDKTPTETSVTLELRLRLELRKVELELEKTRLETEKLRAKRMEACEGPVPESPLPEPPLPEPPAMPVKSPPPPEPPVKPTVPVKKPSLCPEPPTPEPPVTPAPTAAPHRAPPPTQVNHEKSQGAAKSRGPLKTRPFAKPPGTEGGDTAVPEYDQACFR